MPQLNDGDGCKIGLCDLGDASVKYVPTLAGNSLFLAIFALLLAIQAFQSYHYRIWSYSISMMIGLALEVAGYVGRVQMHYNPFWPDPFLTYIICLTIGPVFFAAAIYLSLSRIIVHYGPQHSRFTPKSISIIFMSFDAVALVLQAVGGALANEADDIAGREKGTHIMVAGLGFQVLSLLIFVSIAGEFALRVRRARKFAESIGGVFEKGNGGDESANSSYEGVKTGCHLKAFILGMTLATILILARSTFRVAELSKGFTSKLANEEIPFMILEGALIILATVLMTGAHPGGAFGAKCADAGWNWKKERSADVECVRENSLPPSC